jgi:superfamily I DNA and/or RNA helicase
MQLVDIDISDLEDVLSEGKSFTIMSNPNAEVLRKYNLYNHPLHHSSPFYQLANDELKHNRLFTHYHQQDLDNVLTNMHKNAKLALEENGSSTLYLAVGLLKWYDKKALDQPKYSPILLVPVELSRRSVNSKFTLKSREEETMINITLIEFLRQEYELNLSGLEELPSDEKGVDVSKVMGILRRAIMQLKGWDVLEQLVLGNFSFSKLILWKDIVMHQEELLKSEMVRSLVEGKLVFSNNLADQPVLDLDKIKSQSIILPIATDTSQLEAVLTAQNGGSFILHGPPGTGKSQTITNIIADALFHGKRVLFVAAKKAALDVVHKRLEQIGLAPFTLELHSNKSKKSDVLGQLEKAIETLKVERIADFQNEGERLDSAKNAISEYVNLLHKKQKFGWSLYDSISSIDNKDAENFGKKFISDHTLELLDAPLWQLWNDWLPQFQSISNVVVHPSQNPLRPFDVVNFSPTISEEITAQTQTFLMLLPDLLDKSQRLAEYVHFPFSIKKREEWERFCQILIVFEKLPNVSFEILEYLADSENYTVFEEWILIFREYQNSQRNILKNFNQEVLDIDVLSIEKQWKLAQQSWFIPKWLKSRNIKKTLSLYRKTALADNSEIENLFLNHNLFRSVQKILEQNRFSDFQKVLKNLYKDVSTDLSDIEFKAQSIKHINGLSSFWGYNSLSRWAKICREKNLSGTFEIFNTSTSGIYDFIQLSIQFAELKNNYEKLTGFNFTKSDDWIVETSKQLLDIHKNLPNLKNWMIYVQLRKQAEKLNLQWLINDFENDLCSSESLEKYFNFIVQISISQKIISQHEALSLFSKDLFESKINQYKKIAREYQYLSIQELRHKLAAQMPNTTSEAMQSSEISILQRAIKNKGRGLSIRKLFDQIPTLLPRIAPCMLMSPISVAQYFDVNSKHFDILIFDEASQLPTCEAVSALARAKQCIIVGDPKQMPPTSFFNTVKYDEENTEVEDLESILEDCLTLSVPSKYLSRHYRSKHESLIAFSNANYYENKLLTFPSSDDLNRKVKYHRVDGYYDKGKTRTNSFEADTIVQYIKAHYNNPEKRKYSIGVVTFSQTQQNLIEEKLQKLLSSEPNLEELTMASDEPLFVKNLENVQGDERDIILFSVCYASTEDGSKPSMNFGPLNRNGGWRRLNVAVTRARYEMHIFATLHADQIDLSRTSAEGVAGLKAFLQFAEKGQLSFRPEDLQDMQSKRHLSEAISRKLQHRGLLVKCNIGTSGFKVDIGIINPNKPEQYVLGLIIDGHYYFNAQTANDREMVMPSVLKALGWNIYRVWSLDWYENSEKIINDIVDKFQILLTQPDIEEEINPSSDTEIIFESIIKENVQETINASESKRKEYVATNIPIMPRVTSENFLEFKNRNIIKNQILSIVDAESPISKSLLYKKVLVTWNTSRAGSRIDNYLEEILRELRLVETTHDQSFYWKNNAKIDFYRNNEVEKRNMEDIAPEEVLVALEEVVTNFLSIEEDELLRYLARTFGFAKVGRQIDHHLRYSIDMAIHQGKIKRDFNRIKIEDK